MASRGVNKVILIGNLGQDPEVKFLQSSSAVANFTLATSESWRDKQSGEMKEKTEWHRVVVFGKLAEVAGQYLKKRKSSIHRRPVADTEVARPAGARSLQHGGCCECRRVNANAQWA